MADPKDYGPGVSQVLETENRAWETIVFKSGKPVQDWEQNLQANIRNEIVRTETTQSLRSGFLNSLTLDAVSSPNLTDVTFVATLDTFRMAPIFAHVANVGYVNVSGLNSVGGLFNLIELPAAPAAGVEHNFVFLEVWRQLIEAAPSVVGKSPLGRIFFEGNTTIIEAGADAALNHADDLIDPVLGVETTKRVQIQYRLRVVADVDVTTFFAPLNDPALLGQGGTGAPVAGFTFSPQIDDPGVWIAGTGSAADQVSLGTVDGFVYAIPMFLVTRRNTTTWSMWTNKNGARADGSPAPGDDRDERADALFYDVVYDQDVLDMRPVINPGGWDLNEILQRTTQYIFDGTLETGWEVDIHGPGPSAPVSKRLVFLNEIGDSSGAGAPAGSGDTVAGAFIRDMDNVCRRFSDRAILENPIHVEPSPGVWAALDTITLDLSNVVPGSEGFNPYPMGTGVGINLVAIAPTGVRVADVTVYREGHDADGGVILVDVDGITGLGTTRVIITLGANIAGYTDDIWIEVDIQYPSGAGLQRGPYETYALDGIKVYNVAARHPDAAEDDPKLDKCGIVSGDQSLANEEAIDYNVAPREVELYYRSDPAGPLALIVPASTVDKVWLPERADRISLVNGAGTFTHVRGSREITWTGAALVPGAATTVDYVALRPLPNRDNAGALLAWQVGVNYRTPAPQMVGADFAGAATISIKPRQFSDFLHVITAGSGTFTDSGYPYQAPFDQIPLSAPSPTLTGDDEIINPLELTSIADFSMATGYMRILANVPMITPLTGSGFDLADQDVDAENRTMYKTGTAGGYVPTAVGQELSTFATHRAVLPVLVETIVDGAGGERGELYVAMFTGYVAGSGNLASLPTVADDTNVVALYRVPNNLLASKLNI